MDEICLLDGPVCSKSALDYAVSSYCYDVHAGELSGAQNLVRDTGRRPKMSHVLRRPWLGGLAEAFAVDSIDSLEHSKVSWSLLEPHALAEDCW